MRVRRLAGGGMVVFYRKEPISFSVSTTISGTSDNPMTISQQNGESGTVLKIAANAGTDITDTCIITPIMKEPISFGFPVIPVYNKDFSLLRLKEWTN